MRLPAVIAAVVAAPVTFGLVMVAWSVGWRFPVEPVTFALFFLVAFTVQAILERRRGATHAD